MAILCALLFTTHMANAEDPVRADALFREAKALAARGELDRACTLFEESSRLERAAGTLLNWADAEERRGRLATAEELFRRASETIAADDERRAYAERRAAALGPRVPRLTLQAPPGAPASLAVTSEGSLWTRASFGVPLPVDPGRHEYRVTAEGFTPRVVVITLDEGQTSSHLVVPGDALARQSSFETGYVDPSIVDRRAANRRTGLVIGAVGAGALGTGIVTGIMVVHYASVYESHCTPACDPEGARAANAGRPLGIVSPIALGVGVVGLGLGTYLLLSNPPPRSAARTRVRFGPTSFAIDGTF